MSFFPILMLVVAFAAIGVGIHAARSTGRISKVYSSQKVSVDLRYVVAGLLVVLGLFLTIPGVIGFFGQLDVAADMLGISEGDGSAGIDKADALQIAGLGLAMFFLAIDSLNSGPKSP